jgi:hypothetical protein
MAKGFSLHVGINRASSDFPKAPTLFGCENDARAMCDIAVDSKFARSRLLIGPQATLGEVTREITLAARGPGDKLVSGDIFLFTFAGHGCGVPDKNGDEPDDQQDEAILLFDRLLIDDVLERKLWPLFDDGVRILMVSDSCHSGTVAKLATNFSRAERLSLGDFEVSVRTDIRMETSDAPRTRTISEETKLLHFDEFGEFYEEQLRQLPPAARIGASVLLLAACQDDEKAGDGPEHGVFTKALLAVWACGAFSKNYEEFKNAIGAKIPAARKQHPKLTPSGQPNPAFAAQRPFTVPFP